MLGWSRVTGWPDYAVKVGSIKGPTQKRTALPPRSFSTFFGTPGNSSRGTGLARKKKESAEGASAAQTLFFFAREHSFSPPFLLLPLPSPLPPSSSSLSFSLPPSFFLRVRVLCTYTYVHKKKKLKFLFLGGRGDSANFFREYQKR